MTLSIKLPKQVAALTLTDAIPAVRLGARPFENGQRYYVFATFKQVPNQELPIEWVMEVHNHQVFGNIPANDELPECAYLGWVEVSDQPYADSSIWSYGHGGSMFRVIRRGIFEQPVAIKPFKYYHYERQLEAAPVFHLHECYEPMDWGAELELPVNGTLFDTISRVGQITLDLFGRLASCVLDDDGELKPFKQLTLACGNRRRSFYFHGEIVVDLDENCEPVLYPSLLDPTEYDIRKRLFLDCGDPRR